MRITFNDYSGKLLKAPKTNTVEARMMADEGWALIQSTKSGHGIWIKRKIRKSNHYPHDREYFFSAKAFVSSDRVITDAPESNRVYELLESTLPFNFFNVDIFPDCTLRDLIVKGSEKNSYGELKLHPFATDVFSFVSSMHEVSSKLAKGKKPESPKLPVMRLF